VDENNPWSRAHYFHRLDDFFRDELEPDRRCHSRDASDAANDDNTEYAANDDNTEYNDSAVSSAVHSAVADRADYSAAVTSDEARIPMCDETRFDIEQGTFFVIRRDLVSYSNHRHYRDPDG
jgi:hypothetical protein